MCLPSLCTECASAAAHAAPAAGGANAGSCGEAGAAGGAGVAGAEEGFGERMRRCLVLVEAAIPYVAMVDGVHARSFAGAPPGPPACAVRWGVSKRLRQRDIMGNFGAATAPVRTDWFSMP